MNRALAEIAELVERETGIKSRETPDRSFAAAVARAAPGMDPPTLLHALRIGGGRAELLRRLIDEVTVNETFFFRHAEQLRALDWRGLLASARSDGATAIRVWVPACATGEEPYTLAVLAREALGPHCSVSILGTDISQAALVAGRRGIYGARSTRAVPPDLRSKYLMPDPDGLVVRDELRGMMDFRQHNLVGDPIPGGAPFDLISCRNVLIYFDPETAQRVLNLLTSALAGGGTLILGAADRISLPSAGRSVEPRSRVPTGPRVGIPAKPAPRPRHVPAPTRDSVSAPLPTAPESGVARALAAANDGRLGEAIALTARVLEAEPLNADAHFVRGLAELGAGDPAGAVTSLRRALYARPDFVLAAFRLAGALERCGQPVAAVSAYKQTLSMFDGLGKTGALLMEHVATSDVAAACRLRLRVIAATGPVPA
jgi:chemotaxis protein methyltransferase CheR